MERFFLNPWALAFGALAGGIVLLYILKLRRLRVVVGSTLLWQRSVLDHRANAPWQKLRSNLLMYLQLLAVLLLAVALARPFIFGNALTGGRTVVVLDTSSSMLATDEEPDRLGVALRGAQSAVQDIAKQDEAMLITAGPQPRILQSFTSDKGELQAALARVRPLVGGQADIDAALRLVSSVVAGSQGRARVVIFSDGAVPELDPFSTTDLNLSFFPVGKSGDNAGIVSAGARRRSGTEDYELFVALRSHLPAPSPADLTLSVDGRDVDVRSVELQPGKRSEIVLSGLPYTPQPLKLSLELEGQADQLKADNEAYLVLPQQQRFRVALCTTGESLLLRRVLGSIPGIDLFTYDGNTLSGTAANPDGQIDVWVVEGDAAHREDPAASYLFINSSKGALLPVRPGEEVEMDFTADPPIVPAVVGVDAGSPWLRFTNLSDLRLSAMRRVQLQAWGHALVDASEGPLIVEGDRDGQRSLYLAFDIYRSDFPLRAAFPIFMSNALSILGSASSAAQGQPVQAGERIDLTAPVGATKVEVMNPAGERSIYALNTRGFTLAETSTIGIYQLSFGSEAEDASFGKLSVPVSLLSEAESRIAPAAALRIKGAEQAISDAGGAEQVQIAGSRQVRINHEFYAWLLAAVLALIALEWFLYHTRAF